MKFNDPRHFGTLKFVRGRKALEKKLSTIGPDMLSDPPTAEEFSTLILKKSSRTICEALLDQSTISGVGNYIKSEALYRAKILPTRPVTDISPYEYVMLHKAVIDVCKEAYEARGSTISTYRNVDDTPGDGQFSFRVYGRDLDPLGNVVFHATTPDGRTSWWVPTVQT
jgi:formamidopyrimidine-DNA glycosylase